MIGVGIVGLGKSGLDIHVPCIEATPGFEVVAGCDPTEARRKLAETRVAGIRVYSDLSEFLADERIGLVVITTPTASHETIALQAIAAGKDVLIDKPMALDLAGTDRIIRAAEQAGRTVSMFQNRRWEPGFMLIQRLLADGVVGRVLGIESRRVRFDSTLAYPAQEFRPSWRQEKAYGGGVIYDCVPHDVDQLLLLAPGPIAGIYAETKTAVWSDEVETAYFASFIYRDGLNVKAENSRISPHTFPRWYVVGENGSILMESDKGPAVVRRTVEKGVGRRDIEETVHPIPNPILPEGILFHKNLSNALNNQQPLMVTSAHARRVMAVMEAIRTSAATNQVVTVDGESE
ncbi:MAG: Gfo/Idh/MocA family oxidoreductase [bacterium]